MLIRPSDPADLTGLEELIAFVDPEASFAAKWLGGWPRDGDAGVVAVDIAGGLTGGCWYRRPEGRADSIPQAIMAVEPEHRGQGIGRALLAANVEQAVAEGLPALHVVVKPDN